MVLGESPARNFLAGLGESLPRPDAVLCVSAHWETEHAVVSTAARPETIHDFYGFPEALYRMGYAAPGAPGLAAHVAQELAWKGIPCSATPDRGLDHGVWTPLMLMYPDADVPVASLSVQPHRGPAWHLNLGRALEALRRDGVLVLGSGGAVHNLRHFRRGDTGAPEWARRFDDWLAETVSGGDGERLARYRTLSEDGAVAHPRDEHLLPLMVAMGAGGAAPVGEVLHRSFTDGAISMAAYAFR